MKKLWLCACAVAVIALGLASCGGGGGGGGDGGGSTGTLTPGTAVKLTIVTGAGADTINLNFPANAVSTKTVATITEVTAAKIPAPMVCPTNTYVTAFSISLDQSGITAFNVPIPIDGAIPVAAAGTTYFLAQLQGSTWLDVGIINITTNGAFTYTSAPTLPGIMAPGTYMIYSHSPDSICNLGVALIGDDGYGSTHGVQVVQVEQVNEDGTGTALTTPTMTLLPFATATDIDGLALTQFGWQGILVDGSNTVWFFSGVQPNANREYVDVTVDLSTYGSDGDSVAIMPNGEEAVVSGHAVAPPLLLIVSGIVTGDPVAADTITLPDPRSSLVISNDGKVLLARGSTGLTVYKIDEITPKSGTIGGTISHSFTQITDLAALTSFNEDGRGGMAISPVSSSRAVVIAQALDASSVNLVTGLPSAPVVGPKINITGPLDIEAYSVSITPDGKKAIVGTKFGLVMLSGVDTGTLTQVGALYRPTYAGVGGNVQMGRIFTLGITLDGKYVVACDAGNDAGYLGTDNGSLLVIPITAGGFSAPVGILNGIAVPSNDQMVVH